MKAPDPRTAGAVKAPQPRRVRSLRVPPGFSFRRTVLSHGWCSLPPFHFDRDRFTLGRVLQLPSGRTVAVLLEERTTGQKERGSIRIGFQGESLSRGDGRALSVQVGRILRFDEDLSPFYRLTSAHAELSWIAAAGAGRLLRSPTVFEDLVKLLCTTNCTWALTRTIVRNLVEALGETAERGFPAPGARRAPGGGSSRDASATGNEPIPRSFPSAERMAACGTRFFETEIRAGYRARALAELADRVASGKLDVEGWLGSSLTTEELEREILSVRGAGPYTAENLLKLLGRYEGLALDSWCRARFRDLYGRTGRGRTGRPPRDAEIARRYARFGPWRGLALWCDLTRDWLDGPSPPGDPSE